MWEQRLMMSTQRGPMWCFTLSVFDRRLGWVGQSSSWWLTWRIWGDDMTETWRSWRRPRRRSSSRTPADMPLIPERLQVSHTVSLAMSCSAVMCNVWLTAGSLVVDPEDGDNRRKSSQPVCRYLACCAILYECSYIFITSICLLFLFFSLFFPLE